MAWGDIRVYGQNDAHRSVLIESSRSDSALLLMQRAVLEVDNRSVIEKVKAESTKLLDGRALMGVMVLAEDDIYLVVITSVTSVGQLYGCDVYRITEVKVVPLGDPSGNISPQALDVQRLLSSGVFYYAGFDDQGCTFDLTLCAQRRAAGDRSDSRFFWNRLLHFPFERFQVDTTKWLVRVICGSVRIQIVYLSAATAKAAVISRLSCERVGTRFNVRGVDADGHVANFVESEQLVVHEGSEVSFVQIRGSVPLFWEQPGVNVGAHKIKLRAFEASAPAFERHFQQIRRRYGRLVIINLLGMKEGEAMLGRAYRAHFQGSSLQPDTTFINFDYHRMMKISKTSPDDVLNKISRELDEHSFFHRSPNGVVSTQCGVVRTNCLDCLDRTNAVQSLIALKVLLPHLRALSLETPTLTMNNIQMRFEQIFKLLWKENGDLCSVISAGTGALDGKSVLKDASRSIARTIQNNLMDASKQESFDLFLHGSSHGNLLFDRVTRLLPSKFVNDAFYVYECVNVQQSVAANAAAMVHEVELTVFAGTWNVNGGKNMENIALRHQGAITDWFFPPDLLVNIGDFNFHPDIVAIGLQEIVDLNASNIMKASTANQLSWCRGIRTALETRGKYVLLCCEQLVGVCLIVFVKPHLIRFIRDFGVDSVKTGMGGAAGNKGSVAFRMAIYATTICFVSSHLAAGQNEVRDRNDDFFSAWRKIRFQMGRSIPSHDVVFWMGDFNYRISLPGEEVKKAVRCGMFAQLVPNDQLTQQRLTGNVFPDFEEGELNFAPTYKYDTFSDDYDTSEKCRAPAWTDRVLWKDFTNRNAVSLLRYARCELKTSDHRPVSAFFRLVAWQLDLEKSEAVCKDSIISAGPPDGIVIVSVEGRDCFPVELLEGVLAKLEQLEIVQYMFRVMGPEVWIIVGTGALALAALSMDGVYVQGEQIHVRLRTPEWEELDFLGFDQTVDDVENDIIPYLEVGVGKGDQFEVDDDDDETSSRDSGGGGGCSRRDVAMDDMTPDAFSRMSLARETRVPSPYEASQPRGFVQGNGGNVGRAESPKVERAETSGARALPVTNEQLLGLSAAERVPWEDSGPRLLPFRPAPPRPTSRPCSPRVDCDSSIASAPVPPPHLSSRSLL